MKIHWADHLANSLDYKLINTGFSPSLAVEIKVLFYEVIKKFIKDRQKAQQTPCLICPGCEAFYRPTKISKESLEERSDTPL